MPNLATFFLGCLAVTAVLAWLWERQRNAERERTDAKIEARVAAALATAAADFDRRVAEVIQRVRVETVEHFLGMLADVVKNGQKPDIAINRLEEAIEADARLQAMTRRIELNKAQAEAFLNREQK